MKELNASNNNKFNKSYESFTKTLKSKISDLSYFDVPPNTFNNTNNKFNSNIVKKYIDWGIDLIVSKKFFLKQIDLSYNSINDDNLTELVNLLLEYDTIQYKNIDTLNSVILAGNTISNMDDINRLIIHAKNLVLIDLQNNKIDDKGVKLLVNTLMEKLVNNNIKMVRLDLSNNNFGVEGIKDLNRLYATQKIKNLYYDTLNSSFSKDENYIKEYNFLQKIIFDNKYARLKKKLNLDGDLLIIHHDMLEKYPFCFHNNVKLSNKCIEKNEAGTKTTALELENAAFPGQYK